MQWFMEESMLAKLGKDLAKILSIRLPPQASASHLPTLAVLAHAGAAGEDAGQHKLGERAKQELDAEASWPISYGYAVKRRAK